MGSAIRSSKTPSEVLSGSLAEAGIAPMPIANQAVGRLSTLGDVKQIDELADDTIIFFLRRGIVWREPTSLSDFLSWKLRGGSIEEIRAREDYINNQVCWRPSNIESANLALRSFLSRVSKEFEAGHHEGWGGHPGELASWRDPPTRLAAHYKQAGVKYATNEELSTFLQRIVHSKREPRELIPGIEGNYHFIEGIIQDLPEIVTEEDVKRYVRMLENPEGEMTARTRFPVKFAIIPNFHTYMEGKEYEEYTLAMIPESAKVSTSLQSSDFRSRAVKENYVPGAFGYTSVMVSPKGFGVQIQQQSDHDPKRTRRLGIESWPDVLRGAMHADFTHLGLRSSFSPKYTYVMDRAEKHISRSEEVDGSPTGTLRDHVSRKLKRAYGTDEKPPRGYQSIANGECPDLSDAPEYIDVRPETHWIRRLSQAGDK